MSRVFWRALERGDIESQDQLDYEPTMSIREGLEQTVEWYRKQRETEST